MKRKIGLLIISVLVVSIVVSYLALTRFAPSLFTHGEYKRAITRDFDNVEEENALIIAENINYPDIFHLTRLRETTGPYKETWANCIDTQVIEYYDDRLENLKGVRGKIEFEYEANVSTWKLIRLVSSQSHMRVQSSDGIVLHETIQYPYSGWDMKFAHRNDSRYFAISAKEINVTLSMGYIVQMTMRYYEWWSSLAAFLVDNYQLIVMDQDFTPLLVCLQSVQGIS